MLQFILIGAVLFLLWMNRTLIKSEVFHTVNNFRFALDDIYKKYARVYNVDWLLIKAIARQESDENPSAVNLKDPSVGLMQILCTGYPGPCTNKFNIVGWPPETPQDLLDPEINISLGVQILSWNLNTFGFPKGIAVYNSWNARNDPANGPFRNQNYVDSVLSIYRSLGGTR